MFSTPARLGILGYARVLPDGSTPYINSGLTISRQGTGNYWITFPGGPGQEPLQEGQLVGHADLIFLTPLLDFCILSVIAEPSDFIRIVTAIDSITNKAVDCEFHVLILRTIVPPPVDASGNQIAPV